MNCFADRVFEIAVLGASEPERIAAEEHTKDCPGCRAALREANATFALLEGLPPPEFPSAEVLARVHDAVLAEMPRDAAFWKWLLGLFIGASVVMAIGLGGDGPVDVATGIHCLFIESLAAAVPLATTFILLRRGRAASPLLYANVAAAGALLGDVYLHFRCPSSGTMIHLFAFHVAGVLIAAAVGAMAGVRAQGVRST